MITRELLRNWEATQEVWNDGKAEDFDRKYMQELRARVEKSAMVIEKLDELLTKVKRDCE
jgi:hypothetical protein